jgi:hypothetical protein
VPGYAGVRLRAWLELCSDGEVSLVLSSSPLAGNWGCFGWGKSGRTETGKKRRRAEASSFGGNLWERFPNQLADSFSRVVEL